jgi:hypothetical protein
MCSGFCLQAVRYVFKTWAGSFGSTRLRVRSRCLGVSESPPHVFEARSGPAGSTCVRLRDAASPFARATLRLQSLRPRTFEPPGHGFETPPRSFESTWLCVRVAGWLVWEAPVMSSRHSAVLWEGLVLFGLVFIDRFIGSTGHFHVVEGIEKTKNALVEVSREVLVAFDLFL